MVLASTDDPHRQLVARQMRLLRIRCHSGPALVLLHRDHLRPRRVRLADPAAAALLFPSRRSVSTHLRTQAKVAQRVLLTHSPARPVTGPTVPQRARSIAHDSDQPSHSRRQAPHPCCRPGSSPRAPRSCRSEVLAGRRVPRRGPPHPERANPTN